MYWLLKIVATRGEIFSLKFTKYRLAAGLRPDPLCELKRSPRPPSRNKGGLLLRGGEGREEEGRRGKGRGGGRGERRGRRGGTCSKVLGGIDAPVHGQLRYTAAAAAFSALTANCFKTLWRARSTARSLPFDYAACTNYLAQLSTRERFVSHDY